ncbi:MAG: helix-turn-helix domain-containing protein [Gallionellaceae bacterium]
MKQKLVTTPQAAEYLGGLKPNTLEGWRIRGEGPCYRKVGRLVRYSLDDLDRYLESQTRTSTSQVEA